MNLKWVRIQNYRSCKNVEIELGPMHALVGANNAGKSTILRALDFLFNPSAGKIDNESFWNCDTSREIRIEAIFCNLTDLDKQQLNGYLKPDFTFHIARTAKMVSDGDIKDDPDAGNEEKIAVGQHYCVPMPIFDWLKETEINGTAITNWWRNKDSLTVNGMSFAEFVGGAKPTVGEWKDKAKEFTAKYLTSEHLVDTWAENPKGYAGVLKGSLPHFVFVPAVRNVCDEAKVSKNNPFGRLLYSVLESVTDEQKEELNKTLLNVQNRLNRSGGDNRLQGIVETERSLNDYLKEFMPCELEIEFQPPTLEVLLTTPRLFADDGFKNIVENKGHGLQRAIIFSILRCYSELVTGKGINKKRSTIFAVEEPELYMHPQAQRTIRRVFQKISSGTDQILFSTHSALLLDVAFFDEIIRVENVQGRTEAGRTVESVTWQLPIGKMIVDLETRNPKLRGQVTASSIRDLYSHAYHPTRSEGFFARSIILVEGATEQYSLPIYAEALRHQLDALNISVVDCGGKGPMDRLYRIFNELGIPCYVIFDYDAGNSDSNIIEKSKSLLLMLGEHDAEPTGTLIGKRVSCFKKKWETALMSEIQGYEALVDEARQSLGIRDASGKPLVARYIARKLTRLNPPLIPPTVIAILQKAIEVKWEKSCLVVEGTTMVPRKSESLDGLPIQDSLQQNTKGLAVQG